MLLAVGFILRSEPQFVDARLIQAHHVEYQKRSIFALLFFFPTMGNVDREHQKK